MRITYRRHGGSQQYWSKRWHDAAVDSGTLNLNSYPGKFAEQVFEQVNGYVLEAGCGVGRVVLHYHERGYKIVGIDYIREAVEKIKQQRPDVEVQEADITNLPFADNQFEGVLAFGVYHSLESGVEKALAETLRVLTPGGLLAASVRINNVQNWLNDWLEERKSSSHGKREFHKANYTQHEYRRMLVSAGFIVEKVEFVENMPMLYKFKFFRHRTHKIFDERKGRAEGYRLSGLGQRLQNFLFRKFPEQTANIMVAIARRPA